LQGRTISRWLSPGIAFATLLGGVGCFLFGRDHDMATPDAATKLELDKPFLDSLECAEGPKGDCNDWYRVTVPHRGNLEVVVSTVAGQGSRAQLAVTLADAKQLTLAEAQSAGRPRFGLSWPVDAGDYLVWIRSDGPTGGKLGYQVAASLKQGRPNEAMGMDPTKPHVCLRLEASPKLNFFSGQPHVVRLAIYPLENAIGFEQASVDGLLRGEKPSGLAGPSIDVTVVPGESREVLNPLPPSADSIGIVADFYRPPGAQGGPRKTTLSANCARGMAEVRLGESEIQLP
jgi:predicted component of type VI protein secretion system